MVIRGLLSVSGLLLAGRKKLVRAVGRCCDALYLRY